MSWDVTLYKFSEYPLSANAEANNMERLPLGTVADVREMISKQLPETEWEAFWTGHYTDNGFRLEFFVGTYKSDEDDIIDGVEVVVYGTIDTAIEALHRLSHPYQWTIQDLMEGILIIPE